MTRTRAGICSSVGLLLVVDPLHDVAPLVADVPSYSKPARSFLPIPPLIQRRRRNAEISGEVVHGEQPVARCHDLIVYLNPLIRIPFRCHQACYCVGNAYLAGDFGV